MIQFSAGLIGGQQLAPCPDLGEPEPISGDGWADVNCDGVVDALDALYIIAFDADVTLPLSNGVCVTVGQQFPFN